MYKKIKNSSFMNWLWFIIYLMPFIIALIYLIKYKCIGDTFYNYNSVTSLLSYESITIDIGDLGRFMSAFQKAFGGSLAQDGFLYKAYRQLLDFFFDYGVSGNELYDKLLPSILQYYTIVPLIHLAFDFLMLLPNICHKFMEKVGGERD